MPTVVIRVATAARTTILTNRATIGKLGLDLIVALGDTAEDLATNHRRRGR